MNARTLNRIYDLAFQRVEEWNGLAGDELREIASHEFVAATFAISDEMNFDPTIDTFITDGSMDHHAARFAALHCGELELTVPAAPTS